MFFNKNYSFWSALFGTSGIILLILSYIISPDNPEGFIYYLITIVFIASLFSLLTGFISSIFALKKKEEGKRKYVGLFIPLFIIVCIILIPVIMGILFVLNNNP